MENAAVTVVGSRLAVCVTMEGDDAFVEYMPSEPTEEEREEEPEKEKVTGIMAGEDDSVSASVVPNNG